MRISAEVFKKLSPEAQKVLKEGYPVRMVRVDNLLEDKKAHGRHFKGQNFIELDKNAGWTTLDHELTHAFYDQLQRQHGLTSMPGLYGLLGFKGNPHKNHPYEDVHNEDPRINETDERAMLDHFIMYKDKKKPKTTGYGDIDQQIMARYNEKRPDRLYAQELRKKLFNLWQPVAKERSR